MADKDLQTLKKEYQELAPALRPEEERELYYEYVNATTRLEGNAITIIQTKELFETNTISGENISFHDILEQKGMYKALHTMLKMVQDDYPISAKMLQQLSAESLYYLFNDDQSIRSIKETGYKLGGYKTKDNFIQILQPDQTKKIIDPASNHLTIEKNMPKVLNNIISSKMDLFEKSASLAQEIWIHQPFPDGNKRLGRLMINCLLKKEGYPLFSFQNAPEYSSTLVKCYLAGNNSELVETIKNLVSEEMKIRIERGRPRSKGISMFL
jgi:Fic family protein